MKKEPLKKCMCGHGKSKHITGKYARCLMECNCKTFKRAENNLLTKEPLKGKKCSTCGCCYAKNDLYFKVDDVKSAVKGLLEEIDKIENNTKFRISNEREGGTKAYTSNVIPEIKETIKKWFADVVE